MRVNATQAAALLGISEKTVSAWFRSGRLDDLVVKVAKPGQPPQWEIELEDLYRALLSRSKRDYLAAEERLALFDRWRAIFRGIGNGDSNPTDGENASSGGGNGGYLASPSRRYRRGAEHLPGTFATQAAAKQWLLAHGVRSASTPTSWPGWPPSRLDPRDVLALAMQVCDTRNHRITWRLVQCGQPGCVCEQML